MFMLTKVFDLHAIVDFKIKNFSYCCGHSDSYVGRPTEKISCASPGQSSSDLKSIFRSNQCRTTRYNSKGLFYSILGYFVTFFRDWTCDDILNVRSTYFSTVFVNDRQSTYVLYLSRSIGRNVMFVVSVIVLKKIPLKKCPKKDFWKNCDTFRKISRNEKRRTNATDNINIDNLLGLKTIE